jgi:NAD(P)-dependent dehydrogenase (short-subunit alcohol dehydrogenase family)
MKKNIIITGANRGIGLAMTEHFNVQGDNVYALCRETSNELNALNVNVIEQVDVATDTGISTMLLALADVAIDILVCNAGILRDESLKDLNLETIREQFEVNTLAPLRVIASLQGQLQQGAKIAFITSRMGSITDNNSGGRYGYRMSKAALNAAAMSLSHDLASKDIAIGIYHPGYVQTDMVNYGGDISADESAQRLVKLINQLNLSESGVFKHSNGEILPW